MADLSEYPSTPSFTPTPRFLSLVSSFRSLHLSDPTASSLTYHTTLEAYSRQLCQLSLALFPSAPQILHQGPSEALLISSNAQHVQRWLYPRNTYPDGLAGYKRWRTNLNRFHATVAREEMKKCGYSEERDKELFDRVEVLLTKKTLARPPLPQKLEELKDPEMHLFEDAICLTFLSTQYTQFAETMMDEEEDTEKLVKITKKTWDKMTCLGREIAAEELVGGLDDRLKEVVLRAIS